MKPILNQILGMALAAGLILGGCTKKSDDTNTPTNPDLSQFVGQWQGSVHYKSASDSSTSTVTVNYISIENGNILGFLNTGADVNYLSSNTFSNGVLSFVVSNAQPGPGNCLNFKVTGTATPTGTNQISVNISGIFCSGTGGEQATVTGTMSKISPTPDISHYLRFCASGRSWTYKVTAWDGSTCQFTFAITKDHKNGVFEGNMTTNCNWSFTNKTIGWYVQPTEWDDMYDTTLASRVINYQTWAVVGTKFMYAQNGDTVITTVLSLNDPVTVNGVNYNCIKLYRDFRYNEVGRNSTGYCWFTYSVGMIKYEALTPNGPTDVHYEELWSKNF